MCLKLMAKIAACPSKISQPSAVGGGGGGALQSLTSGSHFCQDHSSGELDQMIISSLNFNSNPLNTGKHFVGEKEMFGCVLAGSHSHWWDIGKLQQQLALGGGDKF